MSFDTNEMSTLSIGSEKTIEQITEGIDDSFQKMNLVHENITIEKDSNMTTFEKLKEFAIKHKISTEGVLIITIHKNYGERTGKFASYIINFDTNSLEDVYPMPMTRQYEELTLRHFYVCYQSNLCSDVYTNNIMNIENPNPNMPFCCNEIIHYRPRRTNKDYYFESFLKQHGDHPDIIFEVKRQINNGKLLSTKYYSLHDNNIIEAEKSTVKIHTYKNYKCLKHNMFYGVDLYSANSNYSNNHHMRVNCFANHNNEILDEILL